MKLPEQPRVPLRSAVLKVANQCNINCTYCYIYHLGDNTFRETPRAISSGVVSDTMDWIGRYTVAREVPEFSLILHGGEPLLGGRPLFRHLALERDRIRREYGTQIHLQVQSNGLLIDEEWLTLFDDHAIGIGISLDGPAEYHDRFRLTRAGKGTHAEVEAKIRWLLSSPKGRRNFGGVLCVLHPKMDGRQVVRYLHGLGLAVADFLLPDQNYVTTCDSYAKPDGQTYGRILIDAYDEWRRLDDPQFLVRKFVALVRSFYGEQLSLDSLGTGPVTSFTIGTAGEVEALDPLRICGDGFTRTGLYIGNASPEEVESVPLIRQGLDRGRSIPIVCQSCRYCFACGGGYLPHRYDGGFQRQTVYCEDLLLLYRHIEADLAGAGLSGAAR